MEKQPENLGGCRTIKEYVTGKLARLAKEERTFSVLFQYMFSEKTNVFYEKYEQFRIVKITYGEAAAEAARRSEVLRRRLGGVPAGAVVGLAMQNSAAWIENYWAILKAGYCPLLMNLRLDRETLESALKTLDAAAVVSDGETYSVPTVTEEMLKEKGAGEESAEERPFGDTFFVMSSGTSAHVKLCAYTAEEVFSIIENSRAIVAGSPSMQRHYNGQLKLLTFLPFYHIFGFVAVYLWFGFFSRTFVELKDYAPETILTTIRRHQVTHIFAVPLFWEKVYRAAIRTIRDRGKETRKKFEKGLRIAEKLQKYPGLYRMFTRKAFGEVRKNLFGESISFLITGGGAIRSDVLAFFNHVGYHMANGYGMSEIGITSVDLSEKAADLIQGSVGRPLSSVEYRIKDGILYARGRSLAAYVLSDGGRTENEGWFRTGDLAEEKGGRYFITGRADDLIVDASGENLNPNLIEPKLAVPGVRGVALLPVRQEETVTPVLLVSVSPYLSDERLKSIQEKFRVKMDEAKVTGSVRRIVYTTDALIREDEFKLNRKRLAGALADGTVTERAMTRASRADGGEDALSVTLRGLFASALGKAPGEVGYQTDFFTDEGGSSLDYLLLLSKIQETFGVSVRSGGEAFHTLESLEALVRRRIEDVDSVL